jgi:Ca-activated chloride channel family protein
MDLLWPEFLFLIGVIPILLLWYIWILRRRRPLAVRYSSLLLIRAVLPRQIQWRRHIPFGLFLLAFVPLTVALARPVSVVSVPTDQTTIILAIDVSFSMCSTDIPPNRLEAAKAAALSFVQRQKASTNIGVVAFSGFAELVQTPTTDPELLQSAIESLLTGRRTAIGSAIEKSLETIAEIDPNVAPLEKPGSSEGSPTPVPQGAYVPEIIVLLTDGRSNVGTQPLAAAQKAADRGVRVYTIGFGTDDGGQLMLCGPSQIGSEPFSGQFGFNPQFGGGGGGRFRRDLDEETLIQVAEVTGGEYYLAESASELEDVFKNLPTYLITKHETTEISVAFAAFGALLVVLAIGLGILWRPLP